ncbi:MULTISPECIES: protein kinase domain-containing protein [Pseudanabaena]|uniref:protein kinase domain-containing protein n=1 Tax=Pseudanabaena TaxID=1152 RepID=UPI0024795372|nr:MULTISPECIES: protein kinase [Pseudanabaena]MEA5489026.1 protein kinase [Pseudanabaena sp. CCNP1317]WGS72938.1 protein kinase [Pseudanabaena galeata CCNP1313]
MLDQMLMDRFRIVKQIGFGAFGETFLADDTHKRLSNQSSSQCVVKRLITQTDPAHIAITRQMFEREASKLDDLNHSGIPKLIAYFEDNGQFYLVQEFIDGHPLSDEINHTVKWSESRTRGLLREVLEILAYVHSHGSIHRDLKPSNIMRRRANDKIVLIDFGAVREVQQNQTNVAVGLASGTIAIGTLGYMPAEQTQGRPCFASDIYAVGCMAIEALTAEAPYGYGFEQDAETGEFSWRHKAQVSDDFVEYIDKMVRYDFRQRYRNAEQALTALQSLKPMAPPPTTIIVTQPDAALPSPNESKTVEPTQVTTPQPDLQLTEPLASLPDSASSSTIVTASEPKSESTASTIVTSPDVQHEASPVKLAQAVETTQSIEPKQENQAPSETTPNLSISPTKPTTENLSLATETIKPTASHQLINSNYGYQPPKNIDVTPKLSQKKQDLPTEEDSKKQKTLLSLGVIGAIIGFFALVGNLQNQGSQYSSSSSYTRPQVIPTPDSNATNSTVSSPSVTTSPSLTPKSTESPKPIEAPKPPTSAETPKANASPNASANYSSGAKQIDTEVRQGNQYKELYDATGGISYISLVEIETCKALDQGVNFKDLITALNKEFDKQANSIPAEKLTKLKEYTGLVSAASILYSCPKHMDKASKSLDK